MQTDAQLVSATLNGDSDAFSQLVDRYKSAIYGLAISIVGNTQDAQDIAQETFLAAYLGLETLQQPDRFGAWLYGICRNVALKYLRNRRREPQTSSLEQLSEEHPEIAETVRPLLARPPQTPEEIIEREENEQEIFAVLECLPEKSREVLVLFYIQDFSYRETAEFLGISQAAVQGRLQVARQRLSKEMMQMVEKEITDDTFEDTVLNADTPVVVDFWAEWCGPCKMIAPILEELADENVGKFAVGKVNVDDNRETAAKYGIRSIPTLLVFKDKEVTDRLSVRCRKRHCKPRSSARCKDYAEFS